MNRNDLYISFNEVDDGILERSELSFEYSIAHKKKARTKPLRRRIIALAAAILLMLLSLSTAMAVNPEFRELVFQFFHINQVQSIPESTVDSDISADNMFSEPSIRIGDVLQGKQVHTPVSTRAQDGVFLVCTDDVHTKRGSHYDAYYEKQGEFTKLEEHTFEKDYALRGAAFRIKFDWAEHNGKTIITWLDENAYFRIPGNTGDPSALLIQLVFPAVNNKGEYTESYYPVLVNLHTGEVSDALAGTGAERLECICNSAISEDLTKMLLCSTSAEGYSLYYAELSAKQMYSLDELSGEKVDSCSLIGSTLACWSLADGCYKAWSIDLCTLQRTELFASIFNAAATHEADAGIVFMMGFDNWVHEGNMYAGAAFALEVDERQNVFVIDLVTGQRAAIEGCIWTADTQQIPGPDGRRLLLVVCPDWQDYEYLGVLDFENLSFTEFSRENRQNEYLAYWFDADTVVICEELSTEALCSDYYLYQIISEAELSQNTVKP